ncbi:MAG: hypothetical protein WBC05_05465, partial [Sedimentisphaerales bacterium]
MEIAKRTVILLLLALLATGVTQSAEKQAAAASGTRAASCLVKITCDPAVLPLNLETVDYLFHSSGVGGKAARDILNISIDQVHDLFTIEYVQSSVSDDLGGVGIPPLPSRAGRSGIGEDEYGMMDYSNSPIPRGSSSVVNSPSRTQPGTGKSSSTRGTTASRTQPTTGTSYSRSRSLDQGSSYNAYSRTSAARQRRTRTTTLQTVPASEQTYLFSLSVNLSEEVKPAAKEFMKALVVNLRKSLYEAHDAYSNDLGDLLEIAESRRDHARSRLAKAMEQTKAIWQAPAIRQNPADAVVYEQLEQIVDLSNLTSSTSFAEVIEMLANSVVPPLQIQPNWRDLLENADVEQTTPAGMDPLTGIKLRKALEILLDGVSGDLAELEYVVDEGVILIATADALPSNMVPLVYEIPALAHSAGGAKDLIDTIQKTIEPESWFELSDVGEGDITPYPSQRPKNLTIVQTPEIHRKIQDFLQNITIDIPADIPLEVPEEILLSEKNNLLREKQNLEMELARLQGRMPAIEEQIKRIKKEIDQKVNADEVSEELRKILAMQERYLEEYKRLMENDSVSSTSGLAEKLARARIELARRREQIGASAGTDQLAKFSNELAMMAIDIAENKAMLEIVSNQLNRTEQQLT